MDVLNKIRQTLSTQGHLPASSASSASNQEVEALKARLSQLEKQTAESSHLIEGIITVMIRKGVVSIEDLAGFVKSPSTTRMTISDSHISPALTSRPTSTGSQQPPLAPLPIVLRPTQQDHQRGNSDSSTTMGDVLWMHRKQLKTLKKGAPKDPDLVRAINGIKERYSKITGGLGHAKALMESLQYTATTPSSFAAGILALTSFLGRHNHSQEPDDDLRKKAAKFELEKKDPGAEKASSEEEEEDDNNNNNNDHDDEGQLNKGKTKETKAGNDEDKKEKKKEGNKQGNEKEEEEEEEEEERKGEKERRKRPRSSRSDLEEGEITDQSES